MTQGQSGYWRVVVAVCVLSVPPALAVWWLSVGPDPRSKPELRDYDALRIPRGDREPPSAENFTPGWAVHEQEAITRIETITAEKVTDQVKPDELVLGVQIEGEARAYSINTLSGPHREVFNDVLDGKPIAATW